MGTPIGLQQRIDLATRIWVTTCALEKRSAFARLASEGQLEQPLDRRGRWLADRAGVASFGVVAGAGLLIVRTARNRHGSFQGNAATMRYRGALRGLIETFGIDAAVTSVIPRDSDTTRRGRVARGVQW